MSSNTTQKGKIVIEYLQKYPSIGSRKIADLILKEIPGFFGSFDQCRALIRYYRGSLGDKHRQRVKVLLPRITVAESQEVDYSTYIIPPAYPVIIGSDVHIPYHDQDALEIFIERAVELKAKTVIMNGDWIDFYQISRYDSDPRRATVAEELEGLHSVIQLLKKHLPKAKIIYKFGNHEERYDTYIMRNAPQLFSLESTHLQNQLGLDKYGIDVVTDKRVMRLGHLNIIHGHEYRFAISNPVNPARGLYLRAKKATLCSHFHQSSDHTETAISGEVVTCWSIGSLCALHPQYMPLNKWNLGFAEITGNAESFDVRNRRIINYKLV